MRQRGEHQLGDMGAMVRASRSMHGGRPSIPAKAPAGAPGTLPENSITKSAQPFAGTPATGADFAPVGTPPQGDAVTRKRRLVAMFCKMLGEQLLDGKSALQTPEPLSPRERQTLELLLAGNAEKQIASRLAISRHTVHVYVKSLYKRFGVNSRGELLARWVQR
jgi:DNA-binding CsgD family transcriptional regulator